MNFIGIKQKIPLPIRKFIHDIGVGLLSEKNYYYFRSLFVRFYHSFGIKNAVVCVIIGMGVFLAIGIWERKDAHKWRKAFPATFLSVYYYLLYLYTIVFRPQYSKPQYELTLFWSYKRAFHGSAYLWIEIILNYILFVPIGIWIPVLINKKTDGRKSEWEDGEKRTGEKMGHRRGGMKCGAGFAVTVSIGVLTSLTIEVSQLFFCRGLFEWDDIIGNIIGTIAGYGIYKMMGKLFSGCI